MVIEIILAKGVLSSCLKQSDYQARLLFYKTNLNVVKALWNVLDNSFLINKFYNLLCVKSTKINKMVRPNLRLISDTEPENTVIFHIHGGGFISNSSNTFQAFTTELSLQTNIPVYSVDYDKAPEHKFPVALM